MPDRTPITAVDASAALHLVALRLTEMAFENIGAEPSAAAQAASIQSVYRKLYKTVRDAHAGRFEGD